MNSAGRFSPRPTRLRILSMSSSSSFQPFTVRLLILSDSGVLTATIQLFLLNSIAMRQHTAPWVAVGGRLFTVLASIGISCPVRLVEPGELEHLRVAPLHSERAHII